MGKSWLYSLKKDDFPAIAKALGIKLEGLVEEMRKTLSEFIDQTTDEPETVAIVEALEKEYGKKPAVEVKLTGVKGLPVVFFPSVVRLPLGMTREFAKPHGGHCIRVEAQDCGGSAGLQQDRIHVPEVRFQRCIDLAVCGAKED
ncbi:GD11980 [Drosophila simulans]|uniref:GD11980 n=1 Tax=Drosophila simulans TaxID=7240 RepID=B4NVE6_DROSI|nr:GD11980 [Drosophila simulans]